MFCERPLLFFSLERICRAVTSPHTGTGSPCVLYDTPENFSPFRTKLPAHIPVLIKGSPLRPFFFQVPVVFAIAVRAVVEVWAPIWSPSQARRVLPPSSMAPTCFLTHLRAKVDVPDLFPFLGRSLNNSPLFIPSLFTWLPTEPPSRHPFFFTPPSPHPQ